MLQPYSLSLFAAPNHNGIQNEGGAEMLCCVIFDAPTVLNKVSLITDEDTRVRCIGRCPVVDLTFPG